MSTIRYTAVILLALAGFAFGDIAFSLTDCVQHKSTELVSIPQASIHPSPVPIPGDLTVSGLINVNRAATGNITLDVQIERYVGFFWLTTPCISDVGSCTYADACELLQSGFTEGCPQQFIDNNIPCTCPIPAGAYRMADTTVFVIPELSGLWSWLAKGDYRATIKLVDSNSREEIACQRMEGQIVDGHPACSGFLCSVFG